MLGGYQSFTVEWIVSQEYTEDDYLQITLDLDYPTDLAESADYVVQYAQFNLALDTSGASETVMCTT